MKVLVTGGCGFIGRALVKRLIDQGDSVTVVDIKDICPVHKAQFVHGTITDFQTVLNIMYRVDVIFHLAAVTSIQDSIDLPVKTFETNVHGTLNILRAAVAAGVNKVVLASSAAVYNGNNGEKVETDVPEPLSPYALSKLVGEQYFELYHKMYRLDTTCLRFFNVYGPGMNPNGQYALAVVAFMDRLSKGKPIMVYGDGEQTRDFVYLEDIVDALIFSAKNDLQGIYNVGTGVSTSINRLADLISEAKVPIMHLAARTGEARHARANIEKIKAAGFTLKWSLEDGIAALKKLHGAMV